MHASYVILDMTDSLEVTHIFPRRGLAPDENTAVPAAAANKSLLQAGFVGRPRARGKVGVQFSSSIIFPVFPFPLVPTFVLGLAGTDAGLGGQ